MNTYENYSCLKNLNIHGTNTIINSYTLLYLTYMHHVSHKNNTIHIMPILIQRT